MPQSFARATLKGEVVRVEPRETSKGRIHEVTIYQKPTEDRQHPVLVTVVMFNGGADALKPGVAVNLPCTVAVEAGGVSQKTGRAYPPRLRITSNA